MNTNTLVQLQAELEPFYPSVSTVLGPKLPSFHIGSFLKICKLQNTCVNEMRGKLFRNTKQLRGSEYEDTNKCPVALPNPFLILCIPVRLVSHVINYIFVADVIYVM